MGKYKSYKPSGIEWIGDIPTHWDTPRLKHSITETFGGEVIDKSFWGDGTETLYTTSKKVHKSDYPDFNNNRRTTEKDLLLSRNGDGIVHLPPNGCIYTNVVQLVRIKEDVDRKFLWYSLTFQIKPLNSFSDGDFIVSLNKEQWFNLLTPIPKLLEQKQIVQFLDLKTELIDRLISSKERKLTLLKEQKISLINEVVTKGLNPNVKMKDSGVEWIGNIPQHWGMKKVKYLFEIRKRISGELGYDILSVTQNGLKIKDIISGKGQLSMDYTKYQIVYPNDFVMNHMDLLTGYIDVSKWLGVTSPDYRVFTLTDPESINEYYLRIFQLGYQNKIFYGFGQGSSMLGRWRLPSLEFNNFYFPYPNKNEQIEIVKFLDTKIQEIDSTIDVEQKKIDLLKEYRQSLISEVITGKIKVTTDE